MSQVVSPQAFDVEFRDVSKHFGDVVAVESVSLQIPRGCFFSFLGPSGCGKTTSLRMIAGFEDATEGEVLIGGRSVLGVPAHRRPVNMVFQHYALFPHLDVFNNVAYGLRQLRPRPAQKEITRRVGEALELVRLSGFDRRRAWELSGGQQQRVALARALVNRPTVLLLDEPLGALDRKLRRDMQLELQTLQREVGITFVLVTHDQEEALSMSDNICIMLNGRVEQIGEPTVLYDNPISRFVADFVGKSNFFEGRVVATNGPEATIKHSSGMPLSGRTPKAAPGLGVGERAVVAIRPELVFLGRATGELPQASGVQVPGQVKNRIFLGEQTEYLVEAERLGDILVLRPKHMEALSGGFRAGERVSVGWDQSAALALRS